MYWNSILPISKSVFCNNASLLLILLFVKYYYPIPDHIKKSRAFSKGHLWLSLIYLPVRLELYLCLRNMKKTPVFTHQLSHRMSTLHWFHTLSDHWVILNKLLSKIKYHLYNMKRHLSHSAYGSIFLRKVHVLNDNQNRKAML